jgi:AcrR family transcriptional regulator
MRKGRTSRSASARCVVISVIWVSTYRNRHGAEIFATAQRPPRRAARNDQRILESARAVFADDPAAPIAAVAEHAGVGISAIYRRYASKDELLQQLAGDGMRRDLERAEEALAYEADPWDAFVHFMRRSVDEGASSTTSRLAGTFPVTDELNERGRQS